MRTRGLVWLSAVGETDASRRDGESGDLHRFEEDRSLVVTVGAFRAGDDVEVSRSSEPPKQTLVTMG